MAFFTLSRRNIAFIRQLLATLATTWTTISNGLLSGYTAQAIPSLMEDNSTIHITEQHESWISCIVPLTAVLSSPLSSPLCAFIGRRYTMMAMCLPMSAGWFIITYATDANMILAGRGITGAASAIAIPAAYTYTAEISSSRNRGLFGSILSIGWCFGIVLSYSMGSILSWNWLALSSSIVPLIQFIVFWNGAFSPRWLVTRKRLDEAKESLAFFRGGWNKFVDCELKDMVHQFENGDQKTHLARLKMLFKPGIRKAVFFCMTLKFFNMMTGYSVINFHAKAILVSSRVTSFISPNLATIILGLCGMSGNIISSLIIDKTGRKNLLLVSSVFLFLAQLGQGTYFYFQDSLHDYRWLPMVTLLTFAIFFPIGWGSVTYVMVAEMVPTSIRPETSVIGACWEQLLAFSILKIHNIACSLHGPEYLHWASSVLIFIGGMFVIIFLPETAQKSLEEIEIFFVHLHREVVDMIGERNDCKDLHERKISLYSLTDFKIEEDKKKNKSGVEGNTVTSYVMTEKPNTKKESPNA
ncbi:facilitated trehalose transporter Tret1 [Lepeophtheirus salmonis]|uniref:Trehalose transporter BmTRET1 [Bombyx mori] n=1 Tax=Lepeophtheirus salmonis TaxID=72036 RepID=A0A0K2TYI0_LEPSM|nr:facilitated trehalose transporter Tret1-like [Lepeophtheirus salmonis]